MNVKKPKVPASQNPHLNSQGKDLSKIGNWRLDWPLGRQKPVSEGFIQFLADQAKWWAKNEPTAETVEEFLDLKEIRWQDWNNWCEKHEELAEADEFLRRKLGIKREKATMHFELHPQTTHFVQGYYSKVWREEQRYREELKAEMAAKHKVDADDTKTFIINMPPAGNVMAEKKKALEDNESE